MAELSSDHEFLSQQLPQYQEAALADCLVQLDAGTAEATLVQGRLFFTPHNEGEVVDPHTVVYGAIYSGAVTDPTAGGVHFSDRASLQSHLGRRRVHVFATDSLAASFEASDEELAARAATKQAAPPAENDIEQVMVSEQERQDAAMECVMPCYTCPFAGKLGNLATKKVETKRPGNSVREVEVQFVQSPGTSLEQRSGKVTIVDARGEPITSETAIAALLALVKICGAENTGPFVKRHGVTLLQRLACSALYVDVDHARPVLRPEILRATNASRHKAH
jgi:hypothetical protein